MGINFIKKLVIYGVIVGGFSYGIKYTYNKIQKLKVENERLSSNLSNLNMDMIINETANKELVYSVNSLTLKAKELNTVNKQLHSQLGDMKLKNKDLQSALNIKAKVIQKFDTIRVIPNLDNINNMMFTYKDKYTEINGKLDIPYSHIYSSIKTNDDILNESILNAIKVKNPDFNLDVNDIPIIHDLSYKIDTELLIANEYKYKRRWIFWKRKVGVTTHIKSSNPNLKIDTIFTTQFDN